MEQHSYIFKKALFCRFKSYWALSWGSRSNLPARYPVIIWSKVDDNSQRLTLGEWSCPAMVALRWLWSNQIADEKIDQIHLNDLCRFSEKLLFFFCFFFFFFFLTNSPIIRIIKISCCFPLLLSTAYTM